MVMTRPAEDTDREFVSCRTLGHAWDSIPVPAGERAGGGMVLMWLRCTRCTTQRHDVVSPFTGSVYSRSYAYAEGYNRTRDDTLSRDEWRRSFLQISGLLPEPEERRRRRSRKATT